MFRKSDYILVTNKILSSKNRVTVLDNNAVKSGIINKIKTNRLSHKEIFKLFFKLLGKKGNIK